MLLLCDLGWHRPEPVARWNSGYYFTRCARCGKDLVRTAYGRWHVPRGYRVVWQAQPPANAVSAELVQEPAACVPAGEIELPIQEVLRLLQNGDLPSEEPAGVSTPEAPEELISRAVPAPVIPDFMDEATGVSAWESPTRAYLLRPARADRSPDADVEREADRDPRPHGRLRARLAGLFERDRGEAPPEPSGEGETPSRLSPNLRFGLIAAVSVMLVLIALLLWPGREESRIAETEYNAARGAEIRPSSGVQAFVTASLLNCRAAPALEGETVKVLTRGDPVLLLARDREWVSLVHEGGQCWALMRYFSAEQPI
jgi:hypothetical protein